MFEEFKNMNKNYYEECNIEENDEGKVETKIQKNMFKIMILVAVFLITLGLTLLSRVNNKNIEGIVSTETNELRDTLTSETAKNKELLEKMQKKQKELETLKNVISKKSDLAEEKKKEVLENSAKLGLTDLRGEGIELVLKDGEDKKKVGSDALQIIVHDTDILEIVNVLRNAGAEAISINDQRITALTPISCIGTVIKINEEKIGGPYVIRAIGNSDYLKTALEIPGGILRILESAGIGVNLKKENNVFVPKYNRVYKTEYIKNKEI